MTKKNKLVLNSILIFSILSLSIAYFIQFVLKHEPCNLCLIERYPYLGSIIAISFLFSVNKYEKTIFYVLLLLFIFGTLVSIYHVGIEQGFFKESFICNLEKNSGNLSKENLLKQLEKTTLISCKDVTFRFLGLSLATINTIISFILSSIMFLLIKNYDQNK